MSDDAELRERTRQTAQKLFHTLKGGTGYETWKKFDKDLARELSMFFTGKLYSREVLTQAQRELCAVASLQQVTYGGMPVVADALDVFKGVLEERGEWEP